MIRLTDFDPSGHFPEADQNLLDPAGNPVAARPEKDLEALVGEVFRPGGWLESKLGLEHRPQQAIMAAEVTRALLDDSPLFFEAGTGVGKSLAYLVPALFLARQSGRQAIVSTHTIALQEQIESKDLLLCRNLFLAVEELRPWADFQVATLVGKRNYLCGSRLASARSHQTELLPDEATAELDRIAAWAGQTGTGVLQELNPAPPGEVWDWVNADSSACNNRQCSPETCFYRRARARLSRAHLIIVNHSLVFSLIGSGSACRGKEPGILFPGDFLILDEAHTVPEVATNHAGQHISSYGVDRLLRMLYNPWNQKGLLQRHGGPEDTRAVTQAMEAAKAFFDEVRALWLSERAVTRLHQERWAADVVSEPLTVLLQRIGSVAARCVDESAEAELSDLRRRLMSCRDSIQACLEAPEPDRVRWVEKSGRHGQTIHLRDAPLDVSGFLRETVLDRGTPVVWTSATLADGPEMGGFLRRCGAEDARSRQVSSPFHFDLCMRVFVAEDAPPPSLRGGGLDHGYLADMIAFCCDRVAGGSLVLFTSYADMNAVARLAEACLVQNGRTLLVQGRDGPRGVILRRFAQMGNGVLFGTDSFWTGVDIPGVALSQVMVTRLPFCNPSHPIAQARCEWVSARGGNPFAEITLPDAVLQFRQGVGRLIRTHEDCGTITLLDSRLLHRPYGTRFLATLPQPRYIRFNRQNRDRVFQALQP